MRNNGLQKAKAGIQITWRNINNLRYAYDTNLIAENEELKNFLMKVKEESDKVHLKLNILKMKTEVSGPIISWEIDGGAIERLSDFVFLGSKTTAENDCMNLKESYTLEGKFCPT